LLGTLSLGSQAIQVARDAPFIGGLLRGLLAFHQPSADLETAEVCIRRYMPEGHDHPYHIIARSEFAESVEV
jgi:hypothetical protein